MWSKRQPVWSRRFTSSRPRASRLCPVTSAISSCHRGRASTTLAETRSRASFPWISVARIVFMVSWSLELCRGARARLRRAPSPRSAFLPRRLRGVWVAQKRLVRNRMAGPSTGSSWAPRGCQPRSSDLSRGRSCAQALVRRQRLAANGFRPCRAGASKLPGASFTLRAWPLPLNEGHGIDHGRTPIALCCAPHRVELRAPPFFYCPGGLSSSLPSALRVLLRLLFTPGREGDSVMRVTVGCDRRHARKSKAVLIGSEELSRESTGSERTPTE